MYVPDSAAEALRAASPIAGDPAEVFVADVRLQRLCERGARFVSHVAQSRTRLSENRGAAITAIDTALGSGPELSATTLLDDARAGRDAFRGYGAQIQAIHERARQIEGAVLPQLDAIRSAAAQIDGLAMFGGAGSYAWHTSPPIDAPLSGTAAFVSVPGAARIADPAFEAADAASDRAAALRQHFAGEEWRSAVLRWRAALIELEVLRAAWRALYEQRVDAEHQFVAALHRTRMGARMTVGGAEGAAAAVGIASFARPVVPSASPQGVTSRSVATRRTHPLLIELYRDQLASFMLHGSLPAPAVEAWWQALSSADRARLIAEAPLVIGNLDGVPIASRVAANAVSAEHFARIEGISAAEADYWGRVASGEITLVVSDRERSRIVEMIGEIGPHTRRAMTYLPGTGTRMNSFYEGEVQAVARYLVENSGAGAGNESFAFVYKDGLWTGWIGERRNTSYTVLGELGAGVAGFQSNVIERDPLLSALPRTAVGHSAGMTVLSGAEQAGARFDRVLSLGGAYVLPEWDPRADTDYHHFQYDNDMINRIDNGRLNTPHELEAVFEQHVYDAEGKAEMESHSRIAQGPETNGEALEGIREVLEEER